MFRDRKDAGAQLADRLLTDPTIAQTDGSHLLVLSIPRGGVVVGEAIARTLGCEHNIIAVKKIGFPGFEEMAIGAIAEDGPPHLDYNIVVYSNLTEASLDRQITQTRERVDECIELFRQGEPLDIGGRLVILVDDGIATGETMKAAIRWVKSKIGAAAGQGVVVAVPVCPPATVKKLKALADTVICLRTPRRFHAVGQFYQRFDQVSDEQVLEILRTSRGEFLSPVE
ncbi:MAG TPA: phosphoribosyltransferase family protein [Spirillospora sp.]|nr:phosphoribosyltransferase family protein [Spirillospora sp.]